MSDMVWEDPPVPEHGPKGDKWAKIAAALREHPGKWAVVMEGTPYRANGNVVALLRPHGTYEVTCRKVDAKFNTYARYIGNGEVA